MVLEHGVVIGRKKSCGRRQGPSRSITASIVMSPILICFMAAPLPLFYEA